MFVTKSFVITLVSILSFAVHAQALVLTDDVELSTDYTYVTSPSPTTRADGSFGVTAQAGSNYVSISQSPLTSAGGSISQTAGFGAVNTIQAGLYEVTMFVGDSGTFDPNRQGFSTFDLRLETLAGTELPARLVTTPYVDPGNPTSTDWVTTTAWYSVLSDSPLIGEQFRWKADWTKEASSLGFFGAIDALSVQYSKFVVPEPSSLLSLGFGLICLSRRIKHGKKRKA